MELSERLKKERKQGALSELMENRKKLETADYLGKTCTIVDVDVVDYDSDEEHCHYAIINVAEYPDHFIMCGKALTEIAEYILNAFSESGTEDLKQFLAENVVQFTAELVKTKKKQNFVNITIL